MIRPEYPTACSMLSAYFLLIYHLVFDQSIGGINNQRSIRSIHEVLGSEG